MTVIQTGRLTLKPLSIEDAPSVFAWASDPEVNRFMLYSRYTELKEVERWIASIRPSDHVFGYFLKNGTLIGSGSIRYIEKEKRYNLGYNLNRDYWGKGYATEGAKALLAWAKEELGARRFIADHAVENTASEKVILKCGFRFSHFGEYSKMDGSKAFQAKYYQLDL